MDSSGALDNTPSRKYDDDDEANNNLPIFAAVGHGVEGAVLNIESCLEVRLIGPT